MNYRTTRLFAQKVYTADAAEIIPIGISDPISMLLIQVQSLNAAVDTIDAVGHWADAISKVEVVDGSDVLFSLDGPELHALQFIHLKNMVDDWLHYMGSNYSVLNLRIPFGRWLFDPDLALDPKKYRNLQLKINTNFDAGGVLPTACKLDVRALCFDQKTVAPVGFIKTREIKNYTMVASSHEYTDLPTDLKIRKILVKARLEGYEPNAVISHLKLSEDSDKHVPFDLDVDELCQLYPDDNMAYEEHYTARAYTTLTHHYITPTSKVVAVANVQGSTAAAYIGTIDGDGGRLHIIGSTSEYANVHVRGFYPMGVLSIPMGDEYDPADWYDPAGVRNLRLDLLTTASGTGSGAQILLQQLQPY